MALQLSKLGQSRDGEITVNLLTAVERDASISQRRLASELGVAVGLVNLYLRRCVRKGLVKVAEIPSRRYAYYLTPHGFSEKARLTLAYLSSSLSLFRIGRADLGVALQECRARQWTRIGIIGATDLAEIAVISALEQGCDLVAVFDPGCASDSFLGLAVVRSIDQVEQLVDGMISTELVPTKLTEMVTTKLGRDRVILPALVRTANEHAAIS